MSKPIFKLYPLLTFTESKDDFEGLEDGRNHLLYRVFFWVGSAFIGAFALINVLAERLDLALILGIALLFVVSVNVYLVKTNNLRVTGYAYTLSLSVLVWYLVWHGGVDQTGPLWVYPITVIIISLLGFIHGLIACLIVLTGSVCIVFLEIPFAPRIEYDMTYKTRFHATWFALLWLTWGIEFSRARAYKHMRDFNARIEQASLTDQLTGILNRRGLQGQFTNEVNRFQRLGEPFSMLLVDVDNFKKINDDFGHGIGDEILCQLTIVMNDQIRGMDTLGRWGGEEFVILLSHTNAQAAEQAAENLRAKVSSYGNFSHHEDRHLTISIGVTGYQPGMEMFSMADIADKALYSAKKAGKNRVYSLQHDSEN